MPKRPVSKSTNQIIVRLDPELIRRLDALAERWSADSPMLRAVSGPRGVTRSSVVRSALEQGLAFLEREAGDTKRSSTKGRAK